MPATGRPQSPLLPGVTTAEHLLARRVSRREFARGSLALVALGTTTGGPRHASPVPVLDAHLNAFEAFVDAAMVQLGVLGAAIGVISGEVAVMLQGFGERGPADPAPLTPDTLLMIDSLTKPVTTLMTAALVDAGRLAWETPVTDLLPEFTLADEEIARRLTISGLFCGCSGVPRHDAEILFNAESITPEGLIEFASDLHTIAAPGETFQYSNAMFAIGGYAAGAAAHPRDALREAYQRAMRERILEPLGMTHSTFDPRAAQKRGDYAIPVAPTLTGDLQPIDLEGEEAFANAVEPAGGLWSTAREMTRFLQTQLSGGVSPDGDRVLPEEAVQETWHSRVEIPANPELPPPLADSNHGYGLGWYVGTYGGQRLLSHDGGVSGFISQMAMLPDSGIGVVVLTNGGAAARAFATAVPFRLFELLLDQPAAVEALLDQQMAAADVQSRETRAALGAVDPERVSPYLGRYTNDALGDMTLTLSGERLVFDAGEVRSEVVPVAAGSSSNSSYRFLEPPLAALPVSVSFEHAAVGGPRVKLSVAGQPGGGYIFSPV